MPDYMFLLESRLSPEQRAAMMRVQELSAALGFNVYLTGGTVRDLITGASLRDLDFTVEGNPSKMARELEKGGARVISEDEKLREIEVLFAGDCEGSLSGARDDHYVRPGTRPEIRWSTIMEDLRRRDFSLNSIAVSLNPASRGLLLDPTNGLSDIERAEVRALSIHSFTNQPVRLLRVLRFAARMGFKIEQRTQEWFDLAIERDLQHTISAEDAGAELRALAREERPSVVLKAWEEHDLLEAVNPVLAKKHPGYDAINRLMKAREDLFTAGFRPRLAIPMLLAILGRLKDREQASVLSKAGFRSAEAEAVLGFEQEAFDAQKELVGRKMNAPVDAYRFLEKLPLDQLAFLLAE
jgi:tRNA nucleotidyltransferase (CCA-adding enzyme)